MNRLVAFVMVVTVFAVVVEIVQSEGAPLAAMVVARVRHGPDRNRGEPYGAGRCTTRSASAIHRQVQASMARAIYREHVFCVFSHRRATRVQLVWMR